MCVGFLYTLTCMRPRTLVVVLSKKDSLLSFSTSLVKSMLGFWHSDDHETLARNLS